MAVGDGSSAAREVRTSFLREGATMKLYASQASSFARKIRVMLIEKRVAHDVEMVNLWQLNDLKKTNPIGKVPALKLDDGRVLINSPLIADYVDLRYPDPRFIPVDADQRLEVKRWEALADGIMDAVSASLYEARFHDKGTQSPVWLERQRGKVEAGFAMLEEMLASRRWCVGDALTLADIAIACHIGFIALRRPDFFSQEHYPALTRLWRNMETRDSMKATAPAQT
jgi:glutathione S-transferase